VTVLNTLTGRDVPLTDCDKAPVDIEIHKELFKDDSVEDQYEDEKLSHWLLHTNPGLFICEQEGTNQSEGLNPHDSNND
jgi:hypothetical protein